MKHSKISKFHDLKAPTHAWVLGLWNRWFALNKDRFHYPLVCKRAGGYKLIMGFQGLHPRLTFEISMDGSNNGIYFSWDNAKNKGWWECLYEADLSEYRTPDGQYYCGLCEEADKITYYPSREAQWEQHIFEEMLVWGNENLGYPLRRDKPARLNFGSTQKISSQDTPSSHAPAWEFIRQRSSVA